MKLSLPILLAFTAGAVMTIAIEPVKQAFAQDRTQIMLTPKSRFEHVMAGENIWMHDSANNQMIACHFGGAGGNQLACERTRLP